jgi:uncharacterized protein YjbI with pentapeptide repeats
MTDKPKGFALAYAGLVFLGAAIAGLVYVGIVTAQGISPLARGFDEKMGQARLEALKVALTTTAGLGAAAGLYVAYRRQRTEERSGFRERDRIFTERFTTAANLLAHESAAVRLAGINSLARLADDSSRDRETCLSTLCSYLRTPVMLNEKLTVEGDFPAAVAAKANWTDPNEWDVRRSALRQVCDRLRDAGPVDRWVGPVDLRDAVLIDLDLSGCTLGGRADFAGSRILGETSFDCQFSEFATFAGASFLEGVSFSGAPFDNYVDFDGCTFFGGCSFAEAVFSVSPSFDRVTFESACEFHFRVERSYPSFREAVFKGGIDIDMSVFRGLRDNYLELDSTTRRFDFSGAKLCGDIFVPTGLSNVSGADMSEAKLRGFDMFNVYASAVPRQYDELTKWPPGVTAETWLKPKYDD